MNIIVPNKTFNWRFNKPLNYLIFNNDGHYEHDKKIWGFIIDSLQAINLIILTVIVEQW